MLTTALHYNDSNCGSSHNIDFSVPRRADFGSKESYNDIGLPALKCDSIDLSVQKRPDCKPKAFKNDMGLLAFKRDTIKGLQSEHKRRLMEKYSIVLKKKIEALKKQIDQADDNKEEGLSGADKRMKRAKSMQKKYEQMTDGMQAKNSKNKTFVATQKVKCIENGKRIQSLKAENKKAKKKYDEVSEELDELYISNHELDEKEKRTSLSLEDEGSSSIDAIRMHEDLIMHYDRP